MTCHTYPVKEGPICPPECGESKKEPTLKEIMALEYKLFRKKNRTDDERRFGAAVCCGHYGAVIELYHQIKGVVG